MGIDLCVKGLKPYQCRSCHGSWRMSCGYTLIFDDFSKNTCVKKPQTICSRFADKFANKSCSNRKHFKSTHPENIK